ncbi:hypothetical protein AMTRI_Chr11g154540 [Amborella trichopoda]
MFVYDAWKGSKCGVQFCLHVFGRLVKVLRLVNSETEPAMGHILAVEVAREEIMHNLMQDDKRYVPILRIVDGKWDLQLERPLHLAGYFLNHTYFYTDPEIERRDSIKVQFNKCNVRLHPDSDVHDKVSMELRLIPLFNADTWDKHRNQAKDKDISMEVEASWWTNHGQTAPNLQNMAQQILNLTCTSLGCTRNFSTFEMYNQRLKERHLERLQIEDPILVKDLDPTSEWLVEPDATDEPVFEGESLTWTQVQEAAGLASSLMRATRSQTHRKGKEVAQE